MEWHDGVWKSYTNLSQRTITLDKVDDYFVTKYSSDPDVYIEIYDDESFYLYYMDASHDFEVYCEL